MLVTDRFTTDDLSSIIKSCKESNVLAFSYLGLEIKFKDTDQIPTINPPNSSPNIELPFFGDSQTPEILPFVNEKIEALNELDIQSLMINDPLEYERRMEEFDDQDPLGIDKELEVS
jgi:hypothetical protein